LSDHYPGSILYLCVPLIENIVLSEEASMVTRLPFTRSQFEKGAIMRSLATHRSFVALVATAFLTLLISPAQAEPVTPKTVKAGTSPTLTVNSSGFFDLSQVSASQISVSPGTGISNIRVGNATPLSATVTLDIASTATPGQRMLVIATSDVTVSMRLLVEPGVVPVCTPANCRPPRECDGNACVMAACSPSNCRPPRACNDDGICARIPVCNPRCRPPKQCVATNRCEFPQ
jgi:Quinohemoprotein amine dehydrogenase, alpha subunit domain III